MRVAARIARELPARGAWCAGSTCRDVLEARARVLARPDLARVDLGLEIRDALHQCTKDYSPWKVTAWVARVGGTGARPAEHARMGAASSVRIGRCS